jgi:L-amino acid N-acyltransferase YncA
VVFGLTPPVRPASRSSIWNPNLRRTSNIGSPIATSATHVARAWRGKGIGRALMRGIEDAARSGAFHKIVLFTFASNAGRSLYRGSGFVDVGVFREQGKVDGRFVDVLAMEKVF